VITVYHNSKFLDHTWWKVTPDKLPRVTDLNMVARVRTNTLDEAYHLTNTIEHPWWDNDGVEPNVRTWSESRPGFRSTSCGDILLDEQGHAWIVAAVGFDRVPGLDPGPCGRCGRVDHVPIDDNLCVWCEETVHRLRLARA
jgi:hypothetical protein